MTAASKFWDVRAQGREAEVDIFGVIGDMSIFEESVAATDFIRALRGIGKSIGRLNINLHSEGGSVSDGMAIYRAIRDFGGEKVVHVPARAWSIASVIMLAGDTIEVAPEAVVAIHDPMIFPSATLTEKDMLDGAAFLAGAKRQILDVYERRTGADRDHLADLMSATTFFQGGEEIKAAGFADVIKKDQPKMRVAAAIDPCILASLRNVPESIRKPKPAPVSPEVTARLQKLGIVNA